MRNVSPVVSTGGGGGARKCVRGHVTLKKSAKKDSLAKEKALNPAPTLPPYQEGDGVDQYFEKPIGSFEPKDIKFCPTGKMDKTRAIADCQKFIPIDFIRPLKADEIVHRGRYNIKITEDSGTAIFGGTMFKGRLGKKPVFIRIFDNERNAFQEAANLLRLQFSNIVPKLHGLFHIEPVKNVKWVLIIEDVSHTNKTIHQLLQKNTTPKAWLKILLKIADGINKAQQADIRFTSLSEKQIYIREKKPVICYGGFLFGPAVFDDDSRLPESPPTTWSDIYLFGELAMKVVSQNTFLSSKYTEVWLVIAKCLSADMYKRPELDDILSKIRSFM